MCRKKGRRCPGEKTPEHKAEVNAKRRARYAARKSQPSEEHSNTSRPTTIPLPAILGADMAKYEFKCRLPEVWNPETFKPIRNATFSNATFGPSTKPGGGLWSSPVEHDEDMEVSEWDAMHKIDPKTTNSVNHDVSFSPDARVLVVNTREDYARLLEHCSIEVEFADEWLKESEGTTKRAVDYERLAGEFDAVYFTGNSIYANGRSNPRDEFFRSNSSLYTMDVASLILMNKDAVTITVE